MRQRLALDSLLVDCVQFLKLPVYKFGLCTASRVVEEVELASNNTNELYLLL